MGSRENRAVDPDRLVARSRQWSKAAVASAGAATLGLAGWIAVSTQTATASTGTQTRQTSQTSQTTPTTPAPTSTSTTRATPKGHAGTTHTSPTTHTTPSPTISNSGSSTGGSPVQGTTSGS